MTHDPHPSPKRNRLWLWLLPALPLALWTGVAIGTRLPGPTALGPGLGALLAVVALVLLIKKPGQILVGFLVTGALTFLAGYCAMQPSGHETWSPEFEHLPAGVLTGNHLVIHRLRYARYPSAAPVEVRYEDRTYDLQKLQGADLFLTPLGSGQLAHPIVSFDFGEGERLAFSFEARVPKGKTFSAFRGLFRNYPLCAVVGDERDLIQVRTTVRQDAVRLYRLSASPAKAQALLKAYLVRINRLITTPEWYQTLADNGSTAMLDTLAQKPLPWSWKRLLSGHEDELLYDCGLFAHSLPFEQLRAGAFISERARAADQDPHFSQRLREGWPKD